MDSIKIKKGYQLNIDGMPSMEVKTLEKPSHVACVPEKIPYIKPKLLVKEGDYVKIGTQLYYDKRNPLYKFSSPGSGIIKQINYGLRRKIKEIVIRLDEKEEFKEFKRYTEGEILISKREDIVENLIESGLWPLIRSLPFRDIANPDIVPPAIIVSINSKEPFNPSPEIYLRGQRDLFDFGITILKKISNNNVLISTTNEHSFVLKIFKKEITHNVMGTYPACDPGVLLYHIKKSPLENSSFYISGQDVLLIGAFFQKGIYPIEKTMVVAGSKALRRKHIKTRPGVPLVHLLKNHIPESERYVLGGIFKGYTGSPDSYLGFYENSLMLLPEGGEPEAFGFVRPGFNKQSFSRAFLSFFNKSPIAMDCGLHGEERACINCGNCFKVCPVDIYPQFTYKSILAGEVEEYLEHGLLDCAECGLCTYVCPSKIPLCSTLIDAKQNYYYEK